MVRIITTSWDDGHPLDFKVAKILLKYGIRGTFYALLNNPENRVMNTQDITILSKDFEIGGHTLNHVNLSKSEPSILKKEIASCRKWLGEIIGYNPNCFCYPQGKLNKESIRVVEKSGFKYARTVHLLQTTISNFLSAPTTLQLFPHKKYTYLKNFAKRMDIHSMKKFSFKLGFKDDLLFLLNYHLEKVEQEGGIFHLWGHSWEIEKYNLWNELEQFCKILSKKNNFIYCENGELAEYIKLRV